MYTMYFPLRSFFLVLVKYNLPSSSKVKGNCATMSASNFKKVSSVKARASTSLNGTSLKLRLR